MKRYFVLLSSFMLFLSTFGASLHKALKLSMFGIPSGHYSGITPFGGGHYAVVSDKETLDGFVCWQISQDPLTGQIVNIREEGFRGQVPLDTNADGISMRDSEDIIFCPQRNSFFVCGEGYQDIIELDRNGQRTGYELVIPEYLRNIYPNYGFEALTYDSVSQTFYTTTENILPADGVPTSPINHALVNLHLQTFKASPDKDAEGRPIFEPSHQFLYELDMPRATRTARTHTHGVVAMTSLGDGRLVVLEREAFVSQTFMGSWVYNKLYLVDTNVAPGSPLQKEFVTQWDTHFKVVDYSWANYEGMCLGQPLPDGRQTLILISDSQGGYGVGPAHLQDYIRVVVI